MQKLVLLFAATLLTSMMSFAQMKEGHVSFDIEVSTEKEGMEMYMMMFNGSTLDLYFSGEKTRSEMEMGSMMSMTTVVDSKTGEVLMFMEVALMGKKAVMTNAEEMDLEDEKEPEYTVTYKKEKKEIAGYKCKKAIVTDQDGNAVEYWYTEKIKTNSTDSKSAVAQLPGQALQYSVDRDGMLMTFTANKVETSLSSEQKKSKFKMEIPDGYEEMTYEEFTSMGGGM